MKTAIIAIALLSGTAALAQTDVAPPPADTTMTTASPVSTGSVAMPSNAAPEHDARGIAVISDPAAVPSGYNGTPSTMVGTGGPLVDPADTAATTEPAATPDSSYPACTRTVTDNCVQTYERRRR
ncbi:MAG TPA: hypothetical protein VEC11_05705 [Allosphingosinicella sp.]|nr:hypothetical protein [Allosphingosinicella sp.]